MAVVALQHIRRMRGGAQSHLMRCSDGNFYVVKFQNNPQGVRVLANDLLATRLAESIGLPVPRTEIVEVDGWLIEHSPQLYVELTHGRVKCVAGLQFGSQYVTDPLTGRVLDFMPVEMLSRVRNIEAFAGMLALDKWTGNIDGRQVVFWNKSDERTYTATFIDQGYCFNVEKWTFPDSPLGGIYRDKEVYAAIKGWSWFEPWLSSIEAFPPDQIRAIAHDVPKEWCGDFVCLDQLAEELIERRQLVRGLIETTRASSRRPFPLWADKPFVPDVGVNSHSQAGHMLA